MTGQELLDTSIGDGVALVDRNNGLLVDTPKVHFVNDDRIFVSGWEFRKHDGLPADPYCDYRIENLGKFLWRKELSGFEWEASHRRNAMFRKHDEYSSVFRSGMSELFSLRWSQLTAEVLVKIYEKHGRDVAEKLITEMEEIVDARYKDVAARYDRCRCGKLKPKSDKSCFVCWLKRQPKNSFSDVVRADGKSSHGKAATDGKQSIVSRSC